MSSAPLLCVWYNDKCRRVPRPGKGYDRETACLFTTECHRYKHGLNSTSQNINANRRERTVFESNSWWGWARTLSTLAASANVTKPNPLENKNKTQAYIRSWQRCVTRVWLVSLLTDPFYSIIERYMNFAIYNILNNMLSSKYSASRTKEYGRLYKNGNSVIIDSPSCHSKPVWLSFVWGT